MRAVTLLNTNYRLSIILLLSIIAIGMSSAQDLRLTTPASLPTVLIIAGTGYIPLQPFAEIIGAQVSVARMNITFTYKGKNLVLRSNSNKATLDVDEITLAGTVFKRADTYYVPFKSLVRAFEMDNPTINPATSTTSFNPIDAETPVILPYEAVNQPLDTFQDQDIEIYLAAFDNSNAKRLTYDLSNNSLPSFSPDGKIIMYTKRNNVVGRFLNSSTEFPLLSSSMTPGMPNMAYIQPHFLANGTIIATRKMVFDAAFEGNPMNPANPPPPMMETMPQEIMLADADGSNSRMVVGGLAGDGLAISADNKVIAFQRLNNMNMTTETYIYSLEAQQEMNLGSVSAPVFNPKDKMLLISRQYPTANGGVKWGLVTYGYNDPKKAVIVQMPAALQNDNSAIVASFSPDGQNLVMSKPGKGIFTSKVDFSGSVQLTTNGQDHNASYSPDGQKILFIRDNHLYMMTLDGKNAQVLVPGTISVRDYSVTADGKNIFITAVPELLTMPIAPPVAF